MTAHDSAKDLARIIQIALYVMTIVLGCLGNSVVIWIIGVRLKPNATLVWLVNLAVADLVFCISRIFSLTYLTLDRWPYGVPLCQLNGLFKYTNLFCSVFLLVVISIDRALCVRRPLLARGRRTVPRARALSLAVWVLAVAMSLPFSLNRSTGVNSRNNTKCTMEGQVSAQVRTLLYLIRFLFGFLLPFLVIVCCYVQAGWGIRRSQVNAKSKILRMLVLLVSVFFLCWAPYHALLLAKMVSKNSSLVRVGLPVATGLSYFHSCTNPILYFCVGLNRRSITRRSISGAVQRALEIAGNGPEARGDRAAMMGQARPNPAATPENINNQDLQNTPT